MKIAILVMAHRLPEQVRALCDRLLHRDIDVYLHIDKKVDESIYIGKGLNSNINYIKNRTDIQWGCFSIVESIITCYQEIQSKLKYDYICNISGQDLPIKSMDQLIEFIKNHKGKEFIEQVPFTIENEWWKENKRRVQSYSFINLNFIGKFRIERIVNLIFPNRPPPRNICFSGNSGWFCLSNNAISFIVDTYKKNRRLTNFFRFVWGADEIYFSTVLYNSPFKDKLIGNLLHTEWLPSDKLHPKVFTSEDKTQLERSNRFFARKFDITIDKEIIDYVQSLSEIPIK
jgi:hypothetical protein